MVGTLDDKFEVSALWQSLALIAAGVVLVLFDVRIEGVTNPFYHGPPAVHGHYPPGMFCQLRPVVLGLRDRLVGLRRRQNGRLH